MIAAEHPDKSNRFKNKKPHSHRMQAGVLAVALLCGIGAVGGIAGTNAFFTDKAEISSSANAGTMSMEVIDLSDIGNNLGTLNADGSVTGAIKNPGYQGVDAGGGGVHMVPKPPVMRSNLTKQIINPGDSGVLGYQIVNTGEKSFDTAKVVRVAVRLTSGNKLDDTADKDVYTIDGLGTPYVKVTHMAAGSSQGDSLDLIYVTTDTEVLSGSKEADGKGTSAVYAYNTMFDRMAKNKFQGAVIWISTTVYAKQHRNSADSELSIDPNTGAPIATGDWENIMQFESTTEVGGGRILSV